MSREAGSPFCSQRGEEVKFIDFVVVPYPPSRRLDIFFFNIVNFIRNVTLIVAVRQPGDGKAVI